MVVHELELRVYCVEGVGEMHYALSLVEEHGFFYGQIRNLTENRPVELEERQGQRSSQPRYRMVTGSRAAAYGWWESARLPKKSARRTR